MYSIKAGNKGNHVNGRRPRPRAHPAAPRPRAAPPASRHAPCAPRRARGSLERPAMKPCSTRYDFRCWFIAHSRVPQLAARAGPARCSSPQAQLTGLTSSPHTPHPSGTLSRRPLLPRERVRPRSRQRSTHNGTHEIDETRRSREHLTHKHTRLVYTFYHPSTIDQRARASLYVVESKARIQPQRQSRAGGSRSKGSTHE